MWMSCPQACIRPVLAAVDDGRDLGGEGHVGLLGDGQGVHVAAHGHDRAGLAALEDADDAGVGVSRPDLEAELAEVVGDDGRRPRLLDAELGVGVDVAADVDELGASFSVMALTLSERRRRDRPRPGRGRAASAARRQDQGGRRGGVSSWAPPGGIAGAYGSRKGGGRAKGNRRGQRPEILVCLPFRNPWLSPYGRRAGRTIARAVEV